MTKKQKRNLKRIIIALVAFICVKLADIVFEKAFNQRFAHGFASIIPNQKIGWILPFSLYLIIYIYIGFDVLKKSFQNVTNGSFFDENFLMSVASLGAMGLGIYTGVTAGIPEGFDEACAVLLFYQAGEWFQSYAVGKSRKSVSDLMDIRPDFARVKTADGTFVEISPEEVKVGDILQVYSGEKIPIDGIIVDGSSAIDAKSLTGESVPVDVFVGSTVTSGTINLTSTIEVKAQKPYGESAVSKILRLVESASSEKAKSENFITRFARYYTPIVTFSALFLGILPPIVNIICSRPPEWTVWIYRALSFLVVSCPCALVISVPLTFFAGIGCASANGILVKGSAYLEKIDKANFFVFDKTGTLTLGEFAVKKFYPENEKEKLLSLASIAEKQSSHPIAVSIKKAYDKPISDGYTLTEVSGKGIVANGATEIICGNEKIMDAYEIKYVKSNDAGTVVYVAENRKFVGYIVVSDVVKPETAEVINYLNSKGSKTVMLTGDNEKVAYSVANDIGITDYRSSLLPHEKVSAIDELIKNKKKDDVICFVGDGINDAPALMRSDIGIAMGGVGSDAAIEAADAVIMRDDLRCIKTVKKISRKTMAIVLENIIFALFIKLAILVLSALGITNMWIAVFGDVGVAVIAILNAIRASKIDAKTINVNRKLT